MIGFLIIIGSVTFIDLSRYFLPDPVLTTTTPPQLVQYFVFILIAWTNHLVAYRALTLPHLVISGTIILLIIILVILKNPCAFPADEYFRSNVANRSIENASFTDLRWLGFSYIAFRLSMYCATSKWGACLNFHCLSSQPMLSFSRRWQQVPLTGERFAQDLRNDFELSQDETFSTGQRIFLGLFKKFVIADALALIALNNSLATQVRTTGWMWIVVYAYAFQIYFDFSGYTDIAIGIARLVGIKLPENFAAPYTKPNLTQFWNSWHMTLTQWFRSYFFNPFNRWMRESKVSCLDHDPDRSGCDHVIDWLMAWHYA